MEKNLLGKNYINGLNIKLKMKSILKIPLLIIVFFTATLIHAQKKEKIKGSKIVTIEKKQIESFQALEVLDNLEVFLVKGNECGLEIEADDNLHEAIEISVVGNTLKLGTLKNIVGAKKLSIRVIYTNDFNSITARNESEVSALEFMELTNITINSFDSAKLFVNSRAEQIAIVGNDKSKMEFNIKAQKTTITLSKNSTLKALIATSDLIFDMYQKSDATIEGDAKNAKIRLDNNAGFIGKNFTCNSLAITTEAYTRASVNVKNSISISALAKSEIQLYGDPKIEIIQFLDSAVLMKKPTK